MFRDASSFNQNLSSWNVTSLESGFNGLQYAFDNSNLSTTNYDAKLLSWSQQNVNTEVELGASGICYTETTAWNTLNNTYNWTINDAGQC